MRTLLAQIEASLASEQYLLSLIGALVVPDIGGALAAPDGRASGARYIQWYEEWARPQLRLATFRALPPDAQQYVSSLRNPLTGEDCYHFRCSLLHQGSTQHPKSSFKRILFIEPGHGRPIVHASMLDDALCIDLPSFCREMIAGANAWLDTVEGTDPYEVNCTRFVQRHADGIMPYIAGVPVVG